MNKFKNGSFFGTVLLIVALPALADDALLYRYPTRTLNGAVVNLAPLCDWWSAMRAYQPDRTWDRLQGQWMTNSLPARPLTAWVAVRATQIDDSQMWWTATAEIQSGPKQPSEMMKIVIRHPPQADKERITQLLARAARLDQQIDTYRFTVADSSARARNAQLNERIDSSITVHPGGSDARLVNGWVQDDRTTAAKERGYAQNAQAAIPVAQMDLAAVKKELGPFAESNSYIFQMFALRTGQTWQGLPVYDVGILRN